MTGFLESLLGDYQLEIERHRNRPFLKASMAACALAAAADGAPTLSERIRVDQILETLEMLKIFDPHEGVDLFNEYSDAIIESSEEGHEKALDAIRAVTGNRDTASLLMRMCLAVAEAKGERSPMDEAEIATLSQTLGIDPREVDLHGAAGREAREKEHA